MRRSTTLQHAAWHSNNSTSTLQSCHILSGCNLFEHWSGVCTPSKWPYSGLWRVYSWCKLSHCSWTITGWGKAENWRSASCASYLWFRQKKWQCLICFQVCFARHHSYGPVIPGIVKEDPKVSNKIIMAPPPQRSTQSVFDQEKATVRVCARVRACACACARVCVCVQSIQCSIYTVF